MLDLLFTSVISGTVSWQSILLCTFFSLLLGTASAGVYCYKNTYTKSFVVTLALLPAMVQIVIMLVNGNLGAGVAVMGAFSLVRFRSVPGSAREIGSLFLPWRSDLQPVWDISDMRFCFYCLWELPLCFCTAHPLPSPRRPTASCASLYPNRWITKASSMTSFPNTPITVS